MKRGLIVGKFYPLHRGHQFLIESALAEVDDLSIVVYNSHPQPIDYHQVGIETRTRWISDLYPQVENILWRDEMYGSDVPQAVKDSPEASQIYADDLAFLGQFDYVFSSEKYGEAFANALGAKHVCVDQAREMMPVSGTMIRSDPHKYRAYIDPRVYRDLIQKVVFVGTESSGKSTLAKAMAEEMNTRWVHEYGRELWESQGLTGTFHDQLKIARTQYRREEAAILHSNRYLFCDTNSFTTLQWWLMYDKTADIRLIDLVEKTKDEYWWILCENDFGWVQDGTRELEGSKAQDFQKQIKEALHEMDIHYSVVKGPLEERIQMVHNLLEDPSAILCEQTKYPILLPRR
jgi:HTH-type transcriptional regulator, transcriptional repressor of NAD biosynthesis genes